MTPSPNVVSPAPDPLVRSAVHGECLVGIIRADRVTGPELLDLLGPHVPRWLPDGFGLFKGWKVEWGVLGERSDGGIWTDKRCRQVQLEVFPGDASDGSPIPGGEWVLSGRGECQAGSARHVSCSTYHAQSGGDTILLTMVGLSNRDTARVVGGVST